MTIATARPFAELAMAAGWDLDPPATEAAARSTGRPPTLPAASALWPGSEDVDQADPDEAIAASTSVTESPEHRGPPSRTGGSQASWAAVSGRTDLS